MALGRKYLVRCACPSAVVCRFGLRYAAGPPWESVVLSIRDALSRCLAHTLPIQRECISIHDALGRVLAEDVCARVNLPPWDNSAMDGYAVGPLPNDQAEPFGDEGGCCDAPTEQDFVVGPLPVVEVIPAGHAPKRTLRAGEAARVFTGAPVPNGAVAVVMQEETDFGVDTVRLRRVPRDGAHIRRAGEDVREGDVLLHIGQTLTPAMLGLLHAVGAAEVVVARRPRVAIVSTGDEIVPAGRPLAPGQIYSSNTGALAALVMEAGGIPVDCGIAPDTMDGMRAAFTRALEADLILTTGGVSVGDFDVVRDAMAEQGAEMTFWKVRIKPGKPLAYGVIGGVPTFGLPGNPVSCFVNFLVFVRPVLRASLGDPTPHLPVWQATLTTPLRKKPGRSDFQRVSLHMRPDGGLEAASAGLQGSHVMSGLSKSQGLALLAPDVAGCAAGDTVPVMVFETTAFGASGPGYTG